MEVGDLPGVSLEICVFAGEGVRADLRIDSSRLELLFCKEPGDSEFVELVFNDDCESEEQETTYFDVEFGDGQTISANLSKASQDLDLRFATGESLGNPKWAKKDPRIHDAGSVFPYSVGEAFLATSQATWPSGYSLSQSWRHFYEFGTGVDLTVPTWLPLIHGSPTLTYVFGTDHSPIPVWSSATQMLSWQDGATFTAAAVTTQALPTVVAVGESFSFAVKTDRRLSLSVSTGESFSVNIDVASISWEGSAGESTSFDLQVRKLIPFQNYTGETVTAILTTTSAISLSFSAGESIAADFGIRPAATFDAAFSHGQSVSNSLWTRVLLNLSLASGESFATDFVLPVRADIAVAMGDGVSVAIPTLMTAVAFGTFSFSAGEAIKVESMGEVPNYKAAVGETLFTSMKVEPGFVQALEDGVNFTAILDTRPPAGISINIHEGGVFYSPVLDVMVSAQLQPYFFEGVFVYPTEQTSTIEFDLAKPVCYVDKLDWWLELNQFEIEVPYASQKYGSGTDVLVTVSLQTRPRFSVTFGHGQSFGLVENDQFYSPTFYSGYMKAWGQSESFYIEPHVNLCYPNVFPSTDAMEVELDFTEETCYADYVYVGESLKSSLSCIYNVSPAPMYHGQSLWWDLTISDLWRINFHAGERLTVYLATDMNLQFVARDGVALRGTFEEPSVLVNTGEAVELTLTTTFDVEFLERGCLDNEYKYINENGDEDKEKFNPVAVELEPFAHEIKARCF